MYCRVTIPSTNNANEWKYNGVILTAIVRIAESYLGSIEIELNKEAVWVNVPVGIAILSACLPTYRSILSPIFQKVDSYHSAARNSSGTKSRGISHGSDHHSNSCIHATLRRWLRLESHENNWGDGVRLVEMHNSDSGYTNVWYVSNDIL